MLVLQVTNAGPGYEASIVQVELQVVLCNLNVKRAETVSSTYSEVHNYSQYKGVKKGHIMCRHPSYRKHSVARTNTVRRSLTAGYIWSAKASEQVLMVPSNGLKCSYCWHHYQCHKGSSNTISEKVKRFPASLNACPRPPQRNMKHYHYQALLFKDFMKLHNRLPYMLSVMWLLWQSSYIFILIFKLHHLQSPVSEPQSSVSSLY